MDPVEIYKRGLAGFGSLTTDERLVYLVLELETVADREGWDHFFIYDYVYYFDELKDGLRRVGDATSLAVLEDYEQGIRQHGVAMEPEAIGGFLAAQNDAYFENDRDWREEFSKVTQVRWNKIEAYLTAKGIQFFDNCG